MNVRNAWPRASGLYSTIRWLDFGVYRGHEDFWGGVRVVNSRPETENCHHGTASVGTIKCVNTAGGMTGISRFSHFYFYDTGDLDLIVRDANAGDVIGLDIQFSVDGRFLPMTISYDWWSKIRFLAQEKGATVCLAAGNGGYSLDELVEQGIIEDHGASGGYLVGACSSDKGDRLGFSNYGSGTLFNSWGEDVATTGYGDLFYPDNDNNRSYTRFYSGTSSATPLCVGALALMQGYGAYRYGVDLTRYIPGIVLATGDSRGFVQGIGFRPLLVQALDHIDEVLGA